MKINPKTNLPNYMHIVDDKLIRGKALTSPLIIYKIKRQNITQIIDLRNTSTIKRPLEKFFCKLFGIKYVNCKYPHRLNYVPDIDFFNRINTLIRNNNGKTYIHCEYGKRRTGISVAIYEQQYLKKDKYSIIQNMLDLGYKELKSNSKSSKAVRLKTIFNDFLNKYYPNEITEIYKKLNLPKN